MFKNNINNLKTIIIEYYYGNKRQNYTTRRKFYR